MYAVYFHFVLLMRSQAAEFGLMARAVEALVSQRSERQGEGCERIPRISVAPFLTGDESAKAAVAAEWDDACRHVGFLCVVDHGVPAGVIKECWDASIEYFDRPLSEKIDSVQMSDEYPYGYQGFGTENLQASLDDDELGPGDLKEMFNICLGSAEPAADMPTPRWPRNSARLRAAWSAYYRALQHLSETLYRVCARALGLPESWFEDKISRHRNSLRAINYPGLVPPLVPRPGQVRASVHTDYGALTLLRLGGENPEGLQVMGASGAWVDVGAGVGDGFVVNLGDLMARWTNDRWLSTPHRVVNPPSEKAARARRQSLAYFCNVNMDVRVECIPTCCGGEFGEPKYEPITAGEHLMRKHQQTVAGQLCYEGTRGRS